MSITAPCEPPKSATTRPLAAAAARLRGQPGRPRKHPRPVTSSVTLGATQRQQEPISRPLVQHTGVPPRLLGVREAGDYLGVSRFTIRNMIRDGRLHPVSVPGLKRALVDRHDLDALIESWKAS